MAGRLSLTVLAREVGVDLDELLVTLWDCGLEQFDDPADTVAGAELKQVLRALGMPAYKELRASGYWLKRTRLTEPQLAEILAAAKLKWRPGNKNLPLGSPWVLRDVVRAVGAKTTSEAPPPSPCKPTKAPQSEFEWQTVGAVHPNMRYLTPDEVLQIRRHIANEFSKSSDPFFETGVVNRTLLESAVARPQTSLGSESKYPSVEMAAAALLHSLVLNHPFHDGNKRTGLVAMLVFLDENGFLLTCHDDGVFKFVLQVAKHGLIRAEGPHRADIETLEAARWIHRNSRQIDHSERPLKWIRLKRLLRGYGCQFETPRTGNRINIERSVQKKSLLGLVTRRQPLRVQVFFAGDGTEADPTTVAAIRRALELDEAHGIDSKIFYDDDADAVDDFIQLYRKTLQRLSRL